MGNPIWMWDIEQLHGTPRFGLCVSIHQAEADIFGAYSSRARETISEGEVYPCMKMGGNLLTFQQASMPSNELVRRRSPGNKFKIREVRVDGGKYRRVGVKLWDCFIWAPLKENILYKRGSKFLRPDKDASRSQDTRRGPTMAGLSAEELHERFGG